MDILIRKSLTEIQAANDKAWKALKDDRSTYETTTSNIVDTVYGKNRSMLKTEYINRWAIGIKKGSPDTGTQDVYVKALQSDFILDDRTELVDSGLLRTLSRKLGTLFTMDSQTWRYVNEAGDEDEDVATTIQEQRDYGLWIDAVTRADQCSVAAEQCAVLLSWRDGVRYACVEPQHFVAIYGASVTSGGQEYAANYADIEDASCVIMRESTAATSSDLSVYACWMGRSDDEPTGRYFRYAANSTSWLDVPERGNSSVFYESESGNPLTVEQNARGVEAVPHEYPFVVLYGSRVDTLCEVPADDLYWTNVDTSLGLSRVLTAGIINARGVLELKNPDGAPLPSTLEGIVVTGRNQSVSAMQLDSDSVTGGLETVLAVCRFVLQQYGVPASELSVEGAPTTESGVAVLLKNAPLETARKHRQKINEGSVRRMFDIERTLINAYGDSAQAIPVDVKQIWNAGAFTPPMDLTAMAQRHEIELRNGTIDKVDAIAERWGMTREDAQARLDSMAEAKAEEPVEEKPAVVPPGGLLFGRAARKAKVEEKTEEPPK